MFKIAAFLFAIAALGGLTLAALHFRAHGKTHPPTSLAMLHGLLAVLAVICLIFGIPQRPTDSRRALPRWR